MKLTSTSWKCQKGIIFSLKRSMRQGISFWKSLSILRARSIKAFLISRGNWLTSSRNNLEPTPRVEGTKVSGETSQAGEEINLAGEVTNLALEAINQDSEVIKASEVEVKASTLSPTFLLQAIITTRIKTSELILTKALHSWNTVQVISHLQKSSPRTRQNQNNLTPTTT